jgi:hypothetical protein
MSTIRTPDDEVRTPGYFYPPFREGWTYEGQTYGGHTDYSVDWNRRTPSGGWLEDRGDPVHAQQDGTVVEVDKANGAVFINHFGGEYRTESRHMEPVLVKAGQKVKRGDLIGRIGAVGISPSSGFTPSPHLHVVHWKKVKGTWERIQQSYEGKPVRVSVGDSDSRPKSWTPPAKVYLQGPPAPATWESAAKEALKALDKAEKALSTATTAKGAAEAALAEEKAARLLAETALEIEVKRNQTLADQLAACEALPTPDCTEQLRVQRESLLSAVSGGVDALLSSLREVA